MQAQIPSMKLQRLIRVILLNVLMEGRDHTTQDLPTISAQAIREFPKSAKQMKVGVEEHTDPKKEAELEVEGELGSIVRKRPATQVARSREKRPILPNLGRRLYSKPGIL